jgi:hypothetical protein
MSYQHIENLYRNQHILLFRECWALEKIHGTTATVRWSDGRIHLNPGGSDREEFVKNFDLQDLQERFEKLGHPTVTVTGEAYGGKEQGQGWRYGDRLRFVAFEVQIGPYLAVPQAHDVARKLGQEFVFYERVSTDLDALDAARDAPSEQARRNGVVGDKPREGVVLRPIIEVRMNNGDRIICKHKRDDERETASPRPVVDPSQMTVLTDAQSIADEWVTPRRLEHVLAKLGPVDITSMRSIVDAMVEDITREGEGEIVDSRDARSAIGRKTVALFKVRKDPSK